MKTLEMKKVPILDYDEIYPGRVAKVDKTDNQVNVIHPYRDKHGIWAFDDEEVGLKAEPFVGNINRMIDAFANGETKITAYISKNPIPNATLILTNVDEEVEQNSTDDDFFYYGHYRLNNSELVGWLCPALLKYFKNYPEKIYVKIEKYAGN